MSVTFQDFEDGEFRVIHFFYSAKTKMLKFESISKGLDLDFVSRGELIYFLKISRKNLFFFIVVGNRKKIVLQLYY